MEKLDKYDMDYIVSCGARVTWYNHSTNRYEEYPFTTERKAFLDSLRVEDDSHFLYTDKHGVEIRLCAYRETKDGPLLGFLWAAAPEERFFDYWVDPSVIGPFEITQKEIKAYSYSRADGANWEP